MFLQLEAYMLDVDLDGLASVLCIFTSENKLNLIIELITEHFKGNFK